MNELTALIQSGMTRGEMVRALVKKYSISVSRARLIVDIARGVIASDVIISGGAGRNALTPVLPL